MKKLIKSILPPFFLSFKKKLFSNGISFRGNYQSWSDAENSAIGYDTDSIFKTTERSVEQVLSGKAFYERDSVAFYEENYNWRLISFILLVALKNKKLNVVDFGGSLGSTYLQNKKFIKTCTQLTWNVIEQKQFVESGKRLFEFDEKINFFENLSELDGQGIDILLMSCVLPYIKEPYKTLREALACKPCYVIIDRHPILFEGETDILTVQNVPSKIYEASYPAWFFNRDKFLSQFDDSFKLVNESNSDDRVNYPCEYKSFFFRRVEND